MAPKGGNTKKESGRAKKAENEAKKQEQATVEKEKKESEKWVDKDGKSSKAKEEKEEKRKADLARKAENARLLAEEEAAASSSKPKNPIPKKKAAVKDVKPAGPGAIAAGGGLAGPSKSETKDPEAEVQSFAGTGIDNALDIMDVVTAKADKASVGQQAANIEKHPERRFKPALEAYQERELPKIKEEHPGLRLQQYKELLYKQFQKSPENPHNQVTVAYDASKEEKVEVLKAKQAQVEERLREK